MKNHLNFAFEYTEYSHSNFGNNFDKVNNFYNDIKVDCSYNSEKKLLQNKAHLSFINNTF